MVTKQQTTSIHARQAGCPSILFSEEEGIFWLKGDNLGRAKKLLELSCDQKAVGFDAETVRVYIDDLADRGVSVGIIRGNKMQTITRQQPIKPEKVKSATIWLAPTCLFDERDLSCLKHRLTGNGSSLRDLVETMQPQIATGGVRDFGILYVYQVAEDLYEIDWELTSVSKLTVEALALTAHQTGQPLCCELVAPKPKRMNGVRQIRKTGSASVPQFTVSEPVAYGQLRFEI